MNITVGRKWIKLPRPDLLAVHHTYRYFEGGDSSHTFTAHPYFLHFDCNTQSLNLDPFLEIFSQKVETELRLASSTELA